MEYKRLAEILNMCTRCGYCCNPVLLGMTKTEFINSCDEDDAQDVSSMRKYDAEFMKKHFKRISRKEASELSDYCSDTEGLFFYVCDLFDTETRSCSDRANRPPACYGYPIYAMRADDPMNSQYPDCGYNGLCLSQEDIDYVNSAVFNISELKDK